MDNRAIPYKTDILWHCGCPPGVCRHRYSDARCNARRPANTTPPNRPSPAVYYEQGVEMVVDPGVDPLAIGRAIAFLGALARTLE